MEDFIYYNNIFSDDEINELMLYWSTIDIKYHSDKNIWDTSSEFKTKIESQIRNVEIVGISIDKIPFLTKRIFESFSRIINDFSMEGPHYFTRYPLGGFHSSHIDSGIINNVSRDKVITIQLSDENSYEGGDLIINGIKAPRTKGSIILYNGNVLHEVTPVTKGDRFAITECAGERK
jgi:hypothetical protein